MHNDLALKMSVGHANADLFSCNSCFLGYLDGEEYLDFSSGMINLPFTVSLTINIKELKCQYL